MMPNFAPKCGYKFNVTSPSTMPAEVDCTDEFLARSDWRLTFHYKINGEYQRYSGKISDTKSSPRTTFVINCKDNGYVQDLTLFHSNGNII